MAKLISSESAKPDVAGAMQAVRAKKSRAQIKAERFQPFVEVIDMALAENWSWSAIVTLIRKHDGPSVTKKEAEELYTQLKSQRMPPTAAELIMKDVLAGKATNAPHADAKDTVSA
ncbi:hypothetical protein P9239_06300 [Caballeronia sp. LZ062]|uniref:hypothetical protein n=1 Tax=unclassified Caballeronia TaxID=2646786 RepID=UPI00286017A5|nr:MULTISPECIES: hypothetical protein [unclassified Caballeronia]MDR5855506.1 hypothetical protein [Caballeronia sp. LZ050]MDR5869968.1 hypothetical protein [Caballeronia sp. LZ062]